VIQWMFTEQMVRLDCWPGADCFLYLPVTPAMWLCGFSASLCFVAAFAVSRIGHVSLWD